MRLGLLASAILTASVACASPGAARAQYIYFDTNGDGVSDYNDSVYAPTDTISVWIDTAHDRDGAVATCPTGEELAISGYELTFNTSTYHGASIVYGPWINRVPEFNIDLGTVQAGNALHVGYAAQATAASLPAGKYLLGEIAVQTTGSICDHQMNLLPYYTFAQEILGTSFMSQCPGENGDHQMRLGLDFTDVNTGGVICDGVVQTTWGQIKQQYH